MTYAKDTSVPVNKTRLDIEYMLKQSGATEYIQGNSGSRQAIAFTLGGKKFRLTLDIPDIDSPEIQYTKTHRVRSKTDAESYLKQIERMKWRQLYLVIKAKLVAIESGITTIEQEFRDNMLLPNGQTVGEYIGPQIEQAYITGCMPPLIPMI